MYSRSSMNRAGSSKSISTSTTLRQRSPSIQILEPMSPRQSSMFQAPVFLDDNIENLSVLKHLITNEQKIINGHKSWCLKVSHRIDNLFEDITSHIQNVLAQERIKMRKTVEHDYCEFLDFMKDAKNKIKEFYSQRSQLQSQKVVAVQKQFSLQNNQYYSSQNLEARNPYQQQNQQIQQFRKLNKFYSSGQDTMNELCNIAREHLSFRDKLEQKEQQFDYILDKFRETIDYSVGKMVDCCRSYLTNDFIVQ